ncbi:MAG: G-D-S-L family lipolytic protein [Bacteroidetes bacterium]|nr:MAG: G-D-S-L family lipolytic protein [Bacteroidota bacterium]
MRNFRLQILVFFLLAICSPTAKAQHSDYADEISAYKHQDSVHFPTNHPILFVGSSSFNFWKDMQNYFPGYPILNRGFGGSTLLHVIHYADEIIFPYKPRQIVIYCGENDIAYVDSVTGQTVLNRFKILFDMIRKEMPNVNIVYISIKPSPSRANLAGRMEEANRLIKEFISQQQNAAYVDVYHLMLNKNSKPFPDIFREDSLHMNAKGYAIWQKAIQPYLLK